MGKNKDIHGDNLGLDVIMGFHSDSKNTKDLDLVTAREKINEHVEGSPLFLEYFSRYRPLDRKINETFLATGVNRYDSHGIAEDWVFDAWGWGKITTYQSYEYKDLRSGSVGVVPNSGFRIVKSISAKNAFCEQYTEDDREYFVDLLLDVEKAPASVPGDYATHSGIGERVNSVFTIPKVSAKVRGRQDFKDFDVDYSKLDCEPI